ncbi:MAG TPA: hypothetical protein VI875_00635, partial [Candidatus Norongarragalinales archaeon]|nr:hypothetical protein [Candidatus Norongarragalinales archaeon]
IRAIAPATPSGQPTATPSTSPSPTATAQPTQTPQGYEGFPYPSQELSTSEFTKEPAGSKTSTTPTYEVTVTLNTNDFVEQKPTVVAAYQADAAARATSLAAVLAYLLDESLKLEGCTLTSVTATDITAIPDTCTLAKQTPPPVPSVSPSPSASPAPAKKVWVVQENGDSSYKLITVTESGDKANVVFLNDFKTRSDLDPANERQWIFIHGVYSNEPEALFTPSCKTDTVYSTVLKGDKVRFSNQPNEQPITGVINAPYSFGLTSGNRYFIKAYYAFTKSAPTQRYNCYSIYEAEEGTSGSITQPNVPSQPSQNLQSPQQTQPPAPKVTPPFKSKPKSTCTQARAGYTCNNKINCDTSKQILKGYCPGDNNIVCCKKKAACSTLTRLACQTRSDCKVVDGQFTEKEYCDGLKPETRKTCLGRVFDKCKQADGCGWTTVQSNYKCVSR